MRIGIITNSDLFIPLAYTLAVQKLQVYIFYSPSSDEFADQKVKAFIRETGLSFTEENNNNNNNAIYQWLLRGSFDACFVVGYNKLIALDQLKSCNTQLFNIHFGSLPEFKGPSPVFWQLKSGVPKFGLAIHRLTDKFDDGPVMWSTKTDNLPYDNYLTVNQKLSNLCIEGVFYILNLLINKLLVSPIGKSASPPAYQKRPVLNDVLINWQQMGASEICNLVRACNPWNKGALTLFMGNEVKLMDARIINHKYDLSGSLTPGAITCAEDFLHVYCCDGSVININMLFLNDCFVPGYQCGSWGFAVGKMLG